MLPPLTQKHGADSSIAIMGLPGLFYNPHKRADGYLRAGSPVNLRITVNLS